MSIKIGGKEISNLMVGDKQVTRVMLNNEKIWPKITLPIEPGPLDIIVDTRDGFYSFYADFALASPNIVVGCVGVYTGDPTILDVTHGGEPLTVVHVSKANGVMSFMAIGSGLTTEIAQLQINTTGGTFGCGAVRINEIEIVGNIEEGWTGGSTSISNKGPIITMSGTDGGIIKSVLGVKSISSLRPQIDPDDEYPAVWWGQVIAGELSGDDTDIENPDWVLNSGWSIDDDKFVHTGNESAIELPINETLKIGYKATVSIPSGGHVRFSAKSPTGGTYFGVTYDGPYEGPLYSSCGKANRVMIYAKGDVTIKDIKTFSTFDEMRYSFNTGGIAQDNRTAQVVCMTTGNSALSMVEIKEQ